MLVNDSVVIDKNLLITGLLQKTLIPLRHPPAGSMALIALHATSPRVLPPGNLLPELLDRSQNNFLSKQRLLLGPPASSLRYGWAWP